MQDLSLIVLIESSDHRLRKLKEVKHNLIDKGDVWKRRRRRKTCFIKVELDDDAKIWAA